MSSKSIIFVLEGDYNHPSSRIRALQYIPLLKEKLKSKIIIQKRIIDINSTFYGKIVFYIFKRISKIIRPIRFILFKYSIVFVQRVFLTNLELFFLKLRNTKIIYDFDDAIFLNGNEDRFLRMVKSADQIIVSSPYLVEMLKNRGFNSSLILSSIRYNEKAHKKILAKKSKSGQNKIILGWTGSDSNLKFLDNIIFNIIEVLDCFDFVEFWYVSTTDKFSKLHKKIRYFKWSFENEVDTICNFDLGLMPLSYDDWSKYKGGYKLLLYLMYDIPILASAVGINLNIVQDKLNGELVYESEDWTTTLKNIILNDKIKSFRYYIQKSDKTDFDANCTLERLVEILK